MPSHIDSTYLCQLTAAQIKEILVLEGVSIEQYQPQLHRWLTISQLPDLGQLSLNLEPEKAQEIDLRLHQREIVEFTAMTTVMNIDICDQYVFIPLLEQLDLHGNNQSALWGRICLRGNINSIWTAQDLSWVQALGQQLLAAINLLTEFVATQPIVNGSAPLSYLAESIERVDELELICQKKDDFINNIAHDLRAPLMNIKMAMRMLRISMRVDSELTSLLSGHPAERYLAVLEQECDREVDLINNILDLQQLETVLVQSKGTVKDRVNLESIEVESWLSTTVGSFTDRANEFQLKITTSIPKSIPAILTDRIYLTKILTELLNNACKYTYVGGDVMVLIDSNLKLEILTIQIRNQAEIDTEYLPYIFDKFYRVPGNDRSKQGTGLGLSLVQKLVEQLNGKINVTSSNGWTEFTINLPIKIGS
ncbi:MAG: HAMP domain-containing histidine kinase [Chamaesiphon sp.]|nr:HAMP domain-containing histidine kinase [Chamaesiphon sp.]